MRRILINFRETHLDENNKFTLDFSGHEFLQEIEFLSINNYYITSFNCKLKLKEYIHKDEKIKQLYFYFFFSYQGFLSQTLTTHRTAGEGRGPSFIPIYHFHPLTNIQTFICNFACEMTITYF